MDTTFTLQLTNNNQHAQVADTINAKKREFAAVFGCEPQHVVARITSAGYNNETVIVDLSVASLDLADG